MNSFFMSIQKFLDYLSYEKNYSAKTITSYENDLRGFTKFYFTENNSEDISMAEKNDLRSFFMHLSKTGLSERSINRKISSLKTYYKYLLEIGDIEISPIAEIPTLRHHNKAKIPFSEEEIINLLETDGIFSNDFESKRDRLIIDVFYQTGMRRAELIGLKISDIDFIQKQIKVSGKRKKERLIPLGNELCEKLAEYIEERDDIFGQNIPNLFVTKKGKALYDKFVYNLVNSYLSLVSTKTNKSPHILRHSFATHLLNHGASLNVVKELLGHSSLVATQVYTHSGIEQLKKVFNKAHPRSNKN